MRVVLIYTNVYVKWKLTWIDTHKFCILIISIRALNKLYVHSDDDNLFNAQQVVKIAL